jgi:hypothetical protein
MQTSTSPPPRVTSPVLSVSGHRPPAMRQAAPPGRDRRDPSLAIKQGTRPADGVATAPARGFPVNGAVATLNENPKTLWEISLWKHS